MFVATRGWSTDQPPGQETFAEDFLTETRRAALLDLEFEIGVDMNLVTGDSAEPYAYLLAWTPERASRAWITKRGQVMPACIATLVQGA